MPQRLKIGENQESKEGSGVSSSSSEESVSDVDLCLVSMANESGDKESVLVPKGAGTASLSVRNYRRYLWPI